MPYNVNDKFIVRSERTGKSGLFSAEETRLLLSCQTFESLDLHAENFVRQLKWNQLSSGDELNHESSREVGKLHVRKREMKPFLKKLKKWAREGYLISEEKLLDDVESLSGNDAGRDLESTEITVMGIPTCNRPDFLKRCLSSFTDHFNQHGRIPDIIVIDDSRYLPNSNSSSGRVHDYKNQQRNQAVLGELNEQYSGNIYYMDKKRRAIFAKAVAQKAQVEPEVLEFALMGYPGCTRSEGGARNAFLLLTKGRLAMQTDDDTICRIAQPPDIQSGLTLTSSPSSDDYWFFQSYDDAAKTVDFLDTDFLSIHESFLGKKPSSTITKFLNKNSDINIEKMQPSFLHGIASDSARVLMTSLGPIGDGCLFTDLYRLFLEGESFQRLVESDEDYPWHLSTRQVIRSATQPVISDFNRCIGMNFAIDNRTFLPPNMSAQLGCEGTFGHLMKMCFPHAFAGTLPYLLSHRPPGEASP